LKEIVDNLHQQVEELEALEDTLQDKMNGVEYYFPSVETLEGQIEAINDGRGLIEEALDALWDVL
jgi:hypothetical protein